MDFFLLRTDGLKTTTPWFHQNDPEGQLVNLQDLEIWLPNCRSDRGSDHGVLAWRGTFWRAPQKVVTTTKNFNRDFPKTAEAVVPARRTLSVTFLVNKSEISGVDIATWLERLNYSLLDTESNYNDNNENWQKYKTLVTIGRQSSRLDAQQEEIEALKKRAKVLGSLLAEKK